MSGAGFLYMYVSVGVEIRSENKKMRSQVDSMRKNEIQVEAQ